MSWAQQRLKLKQTPIDSWSLKEQLTLSLAVLRTGDQNWVSVSRTMKQFNEPGRPLDWYSQKNCALQYNLIMENGDIPKRKRGEKLDPKDDPGETIVRILGQKRMEQLEEILRQEKEEISKLEKQVELLGSDNVSEEDLDKILKEIQGEEEEEDKKRDAHAQFIKDREDKKLAIQAALKTGYFARTHSTSSLSEHSPSPSSTAAVDPYKFTPEKNENEADMKPLQYSPIKILTEKEKEAKAALAAVNEPKEIEIEKEEEKDDSKIIESTETAKDDKEDKEIKMETDESTNDEPSKTVEPDIVDLEPPQETQEVKVETPAESMEVKDSSADKMDDHDQDDDVINDAEEIAAGNITDEIQESDLKTEVKEEIIKDIKVEEPEPTKEIKKEVEEEEEESKKDVEEVSDTKTGETTENPPVETVETIKKEKMDSEETETIEDKPTEAITTPAEEQPIAPPVVADQPEPEVEPKKVTKPVGRRGRRSKKNSEVVPEPTTTANDDQESSGQLTAAFSSPASTRPTSPTTDAPPPSDTPPVSAASQPSTPKLLEQTSSRLKARRSSRQGLQRALKESSSFSNPVSPLSTDEEKEYKAWKKGILLLWNQIAAHKHANIFAGPVSETDAPDYKDVVFDPMDLGFIKKNIESGSIKTTEEFQKDLTLMFFNATMYNSTEHPVHTRTLAMQKDTEKMIREFLNTQALMKASDTPKLRAKETVKVLTSRTRTGSGSQPDDKKKSI